MNKNNLYMNETPVAMPLHKMEEFLHKIGARNQEEHH